MKRLLSLALCLALLLTPALAVVDKPANGYVGDYAQVLSDELEEHIISRNETLFQSTGAEVVVVAVEFLDGLDAESYAKTCFDDWGIGDADRDNGLLLLFATEDMNADGLRKCWAMRGVGLESALSVSTLNGWLEDYFYDDLDSGDFEGAVRGFFDAACDWLESYYAGSGGSVPVQEERRESGGSALGALLVFTLVLFAVVALVILCASLSRRRGGYYAPYDPYVYAPRPFFFWRRRRPRGPPPPPRPPSYHPHTGGGFHSGGATRGGGAGRSGGAFRSSGHAPRSGGGSFRSGGGSFRSGGSSRGGGAGRR